MKLILFVVFFCLALPNGKGAPRIAVYKFVKCNPEGNQANCVTQQSQEMAWSPDLPAKLPSSAAQYLEAEPVEDESPLMEEEDTPMTSEEGEPALAFDPEEGSAGYEGSAYYAMADQTFGPAESETGSGGYMFSAFRDLNEPNPAEEELIEDHLLHL